MAKLAFVRMEVAGIQKFICSTGKLKEMIGGSELIEIVSRCMHRDICEERLGLQIVESPQDGKNWYIELQANAGVLCLLMPNRDIAARFIRTFSETVIETYPGIPLYGCQVEMEWTQESYQSARHLSETKINEQRSRSPLASGLGMLPVLRAARLDGLPAVAVDNGEYYSLPSKTKRNRDLLERSRSRLRNLIPSPEGVELEWADDLDVMLGDEKQKVALVHMDGNDLGKLFRACIQEARAGRLEDGIKSIKSLSDLVAKANEKAFTAAASGIAAHLLRMTRHRGKLTMPLRPLVMGGDDITVIVRADMALPFIHLFIRTFEQVSAAAGKPLSLGAGMVVMSSSYPFPKAFALVEGLLESAKEATLDLTPRPSSIDYLVLTEDVENQVDVLRKRLYTSEDGALLTGKPFILKAGVLHAFLRDGIDVLELLPRSAIRPAWGKCRKGRDASNEDWLCLRENLHRRLGGRRDQHLMDVTRFDNIFDDGFISMKDGRYRTLLGDYLELERLLPKNPEMRKDQMDSILSQETAYA